MIVRRTSLLLVGLCIYGLSLALLVIAGLGLDPWDVFHQGVAERTGRSIGTITVATSVVVLLLWIPLRERPGVGTIANGLLVGVWIDVWLAILPDVDPLAARSALMVTGVVLNGVATGMYIGAGMGPGPRDGLMTSIARRGYSVRVVRTLIEIVVLAAGIALGGTFGVGTLAYALAIGPLAHVFIPLFTRWGRGGRSAQGFGQVVVVDH